MSPIVAEGKDFACNLLGPGGELLAGGGKVEYKWAGARNVVATTLERHGDTIVPGDVFAANDPHHGGGNHPQDIEICRPVFVDGGLVAWVAASAHLIDVGGMTFGSWAPDATECYQEAIRFPPVRLFAARRRADRHVGVDPQQRPAGEPRRDGHPRTRSRLPRLRGEARRRGRAMGVDAFLATAYAMCDNSERVLRERIGRLADGTYTTDGWVEWGDEQYHLPCRLDRARRRAPLRLHRRAAAGPALHQLEGVPRQGRDRRRRSQQPRAGPAVHRGDVPADRRRVPTGHDRRLDAAGADRVPRTSTSR